VIRDHVEDDTPALLLFQKLRDEIEKIWAGLKKPAEFANAPITQLFEFNFFALPHMKLQKEKFAEQIGVLKSRYVVSNPIV